VVAKIMKMADQASEENRVNTSGINQIKYELMI
jgi:hypothetical protein